MKLTKEQRAICKKYGARDETGHVHCFECPLMLSWRDHACLANTTKQEVKEFYSWKIFNEENDIGGNE